MKRLTKAETAAPALYAMNPSDLAAAFERTYPRVFSLIEDTRLRAIANGESWPAWCYAPIAAAQAVMSKAFGVANPATMAAESAKAAAMGAWRMGGKNVLVFDELAHVSHGQPRRCQRAKVNCALAATDSGEHAGGYGSERLGRAFTHHSKKSELIKGEK